MVVFCYLAYVHHYFDRHVCLSFHMCFSHKFFFFCLNHVGIIPRPLGLAPGLTPRGVQARFTTGKLSLGSACEMGTF